MKILLFAIFILTFAHSKISNVDIYYEIKEKNKIDYLNKISKLSLRNVNNTMLNTHNILNSRNSKISNIVKYYQDEGGLDKEDIVILNELEKISLELIEKNSQVTCTSLVSSAFNDTGISLNECINLDLKLRSIYKTGVFTQNYFPNKHKVRDNYLREIEIDSNIYFNERFLKIAIEDIKNSIMIQNMNNDYILKLCNKYSNTNNKNFINKSKLMKALNNRGLELGISSFLLSGCDNYNFTNHLYTNDLYISQNPSGGELEYIIFLLNSVIAEITSINLRIIELNNLIIADQALIDAMPPFSSLPPSLIAQYVVIQERINTNQDELDIIVPKRDELLILEIELEDKKMQLESSP